MSETTEHLDPNRLPPWLLEHAAKAGPDAMGWLAAGYLAGVQVGRKAGPCMATLEFHSRPGHRSLPPLSCDLAFGHLGGHSNGGTKWTDSPEPSPSSSPAGAS